jgi:Flp pilus assembly pilin Flp
MLIGFIAVTLVAVISSLSAQLTRTFSTVNSVVTSS